MTFTALHVSQLPNITISIDYAPSVALANYIPQFDIYLADPTTSSTFAGEKATNFTIDSSGNITVTKRCLLSAKVMMNNVPSAGGTYSLEFFFQQSGVNVGTGGRNQCYIINSATAYYFPSGSPIAPPTCNVIVEPNTTVNIKITANTGGVGIARGSYLQIFELS
jgi:hypothetical protein